MVNEESRCTGNHRSTRSYEQETGKMDRSVRNKTKQRTSPEEFDPGNSEDIKKDSRKLGKCHPLAVDGWH